MATWVFAVSVVGLIEGIEATGDQRPRVRAVMLAAPGLLAAGAAVWQVLAFLPDPVRGWAPTVSIATIAAHEFALAFLRGRRAEEPLTAVVRVLVHGSEAVVAAVAFGAVYDNVWLIAFAAGLAFVIGIEIGAGVPRSWRRRWSLIAGLGMLMLAAAVRPTGV